MKTITYTCIKDIPTLKIVAGQKFKVDENSTENVFFTQMKDYFEIIIPAEDRWQVGEIVKIKGSFTNLSHPGKNSYVRNAQKLDWTYATIREINENKGKLTGRILFETLGGIHYQQTNIPLEKCKCGSLGGGMGTFSIYPTATYFFINTSGQICNAILGKDPARDRWCKASGNYFDTKQEAVDCHERILTNGCAFGRPGTADPMQKA